MKSILEGRPDLAREINKVAEVAGYLWQKGWAERNGGNITINVTEFVDDEIRQMPAISEPKQIGAVLPQRYTETYARPGSLADGKRFCDSYLRRLCQLCHYR